MSQEQQRNIHFLKENWSEHRGKVHSMYYFREESLSPDTRTENSWVGVSCMVFERYYRIQGEEDEFACKQTRWWDAKDPMHPEIVLYKEGEELDQLLKDMQDSNKRIVQNGQVTLVNIVWNLDDPNRR